MTTNQQKLDDLHWILCEDEGRAVLFKWMRDSARTVALEPDVLDAQAVALLHRVCDGIIDPSGATTTVVDPKATSTLATKIKWMAHNDAQNLNATLAVKELVSELLAAVSKLAPSAAPADPTKPVTAPTK